MEIDKSLIVWAKVKYQSCWPARIVEYPPKVIKDKITGTDICVFFFGKKEYVSVSLDNVFTYDDNYKLFADKSNRKGFRKAVQECDQFLADPGKYFHNAVDGDNDRSIVFLNEKKIFIKQEEEDVNNFDACKQSGNDQIELTEDTESNFSNHQLPEIGSFDELFLFNDQLSDNRTTDNEIQSNTIDVNNYYHSLVEKEKEMNKTISLWRQSMNKMTTALNNMANEKKNVETKAVNFGEELDRVNAELQLTINENDTFESGLTELTSSMEGDKFEYKSQTDELLKKVENIRSLLDESKKKCSTVSSKLEFESKRVKEKDSKIQELLERVESIQSLLSESKTDCAKVSTKLELEREQVKEKDLQIQELLDKINSTQMLLAESENHRVHVSAKFEFKSERLTKKNSQIEESLNKVDSIQSLLAENEKERVQISTKLELEMERVKEKDLKIQELVEKVNSTESLLAESRNECSKMLENFKSELKNICDGNKPILLRTQKLASINRNLRLRVQRLEGNKRKMKDVEAAIMRKRAKSFIVD